MMNRSGQNGLTLVELLIAMAISALVLVVLVQGITILSKWSGHLRVLQEESEQTNSLFRFMHERLIRIEPLQIETDLGPQALFTGSDDQISFVIAETAYPSRPGLYEQSLQIVKGSEQNWQILFLRKQLLNLDEFGLTQEQQPLVLYDGVARPKFSFMGDNNWQEQWETPQSLPKQISFSLEGLPEVIVSIPAMVSDAVPANNDTGAQGANADAG